MSTPEGRVLLNKQKRDLFVCLQSKNLSPEDFEFSEKENSAILRHRSTDFGCSITVGGFTVPSDSGMGALGGMITVPFHLLHSPGREVLEEEHYYRYWGNLLKGFNDWIDCLKSEIQTPDVWATVSEDSNLLRFAADQNNQPFTPDEQLQVKKALNEIKVYLIKTHNLAGTRLEAIEKQLSYLEEAVARLGRFDWKGLFVGTLINIVVTQSMSPDSAKDLVRFAGQIFKQLLGNVLYLTGPH